MLSHTDVIREIEARGLRISAAGSELRLRGPKERMDPELIARIRTHKADLLAHLAALPDERLGAGFPLTPLQRGYLLGRGGDFEIGNIAAYVYQEVEGVWDIDRLELALRAVLARHGMLRTRIVGDRQVEQATVEPRFSRVDLRELPEDQREAAWHRLRAERSHLVLPADQAPLLDTGVTVLADDRMVLHVGLDGLAADAVSGFLVFRDWWRAYQGEQLPAAEPGASFEAFVTALETARGKAPARRSRTYWLDRLDELPPPPALPLRTAPSAITHPRFTPLVLRLEPEPWARLKARCTEFGLTPSTVLLAAYAETLAVWGGGPRFTLNTTIANRPPIHPKIAETVGNFTDILLVEIDLDRDLTFAERARAIQARMHRDLDNRHFSGIEVLRELGRHRGDPAAARMPYTFTSTVGYLQQDLDYSARELFGPRVYAVTQTPQVWINTFVAELHDGLVVTIDGVADLFPAGLLDDLSAGYRTMLERLLDEQAWSARTFDLLPPAQRARRAAANDTAAPVPAGTLTDAFVANAHRDPDAPAVITSSATMSYGELHRRATAAAAWLVANGVGRDELVGLVMTRGPEQIVGILATLLAGAAYLPVDADLPPARREYLLRDGQVRQVLTNTAWTDDTLAVLRLDATAEVPAATGDLPATGARPDDLAYVLHTSGTTGEPKGVMVTHRAVLNVVADCAERFGITAADRFFAISAFTFDLSVYDVFGALSAGAALVLPDADKAADTAHWLSRCEQAGVTVWNSVPAIVSLLHDQAIDDDAARLATLRLVMMSGDRIPPALPAALHRLSPGLRLVSLGGPTETTIWNILHPIDDPAAVGESASVPYGRPNANNRAYVLNQDGQDAPDWVVGEICAAGLGLARGYWRDDARTAERFQLDQRLGERLYRTGDLGRYLPDGTIEIVGRLDHQLKVNGYRIEAGEIETALAALAAVAQAVVLRQETPSGDRLVAHLVPAPTDQATDQPTDDDLRAHLAARLPAYLVPSKFVWHRSLPLTRNDKVDRAALARLASTPARTRPRRDAPASPTALAMARLWASVIRLAEVGVDDNFFELGGHSIAAARIVTAVRAEFGVSIPLQRLPEVVTPRAMAEFVEHATAHGADTDSAINRLVAGPPAPGHRLSVVRLDGTETVELPELWAMAGRVAARLLVRGVGPGDRIGVVARNCLEWVLLDLAALRLGAVTAGFESGSVRPDRELVTSYDLRLLFTDEPADDQDVVPIGEVRAMAEPDPSLAEPKPVVYAPEDETTLKFTSGSTGRPKGLAATVGSIDSSLRAVQGMFAHGQGDDLFVFLPLSLLQQRYWIYSALVFGHDVTVSTYEAAFVALARTRPTVVMGVPAFYETALKRVRAKARQAAGPDTEPDRATIAAAASAVFGDRIRYLWTGSAPASPTVLEFFTAAGLPIYEGYGLNETCIVTKNHPGAHRLGSVGQVVPGKEVLIDADGVLSIRSDHPVNRRYAYAPPGESERVFGEDGVVRTGDLGYFDEDGFLYVRGRADDVIVLDNAKKVMVRPIEEHLRACPAIEECVLVSADRAHLVAVVSPADEPADEEAIAAQLARTNAAFGRDEQIRKVVVANPRFSVANELLTAQFKPRRNRILERYRAEIVDSKGGIHAR